MLDRSTWKSIAIGVTAGLIVAYIARPVLDRLPSWTLRIAEATSQGVTSRIFSDAAAQKSPDPFLLMIAALALVYGALWLQFSITLPTPTAFRMVRGVAWMMLVVSVSLIVRAGMSKASDNLHTCFE